MLEEAVQYVKFLQLQIKVWFSKNSDRSQSPSIPNVAIAQRTQLFFLPQLLSSDDMWMFAPIAYNGVNVGLDLKISPPQQ
jgi:hypothetical protein